MGCRGTFLSTRLWEDEGLDAIMKVAAEMFGEGKS